MTVTLEATHDPDITLEATVDVFTVYVPPPVLGIAGLVGWYDASQVDTLYEDAALSDPSESNDAVLSVEDLSGSGNHLTRPVGNGPLRRDAQQNGLSTLEFVAADVRMLNIPENLLAAMAGVLNTTKFFVISVPVPFAGNEGVYRLRRDDTNTTFAITKATGVSTSGFYNVLTPESGGDGKSRTSSAVPNSTYFIYCFRHNGDTGALEVWVNGTHSGTTTDEPGAIYDFSGGEGRIGGGYFNGNEITPTNGFFGEIIDYASALTDSEIDDVSNYLGGKWGISWANIV